MGAEGLLDLLLYYTHRYTQTHMMHTKIHSYSGPNPPNCAAIVLTDTYYIDIYIRVCAGPSVSLSVYGETQRRRQVHGHAALTERGRERETVRGSFRSLSKQACALENQRSLSISLTLSASSFSSCPNYFVNYVSCIEYRNQSQHEKSSLSVSLDYIQTRFWGWGQREEEL